MAATRTGDRAAIVDPPGHVLEHAQHRPQPVWIRANGAVPDDPDVHAQLLTYASDIAFVDNMYRPHRRPTRQASCSPASTTRSGSIARSGSTTGCSTPQHSPTRPGARGFALGTVYDRAGALLASVAQEGVMRELDPDRAPKG